jgi:isochorismate pyruvate lyase
MKIRQLAVTSIILLALAGRTAADEADAARSAYRGVPGAADGACCETLGEVRANINRIDRNIVRLIAERGSFVHEAGRFKANPEAVDDPRRVEAIIAKLRELAAQRKVAPDVVEATYRAMIAAFTEEERRSVAAEAKSPISGQ